MVKITKRVTDCLLLVFVKIKSVWLLSEMPKDHFWSKRSSSKKDNTLDGRKANGITEDCSDGSVSRGSQKMKTSTSKKHLFGIDWSPILNRNGGRKTEEHDSKVPRSVSSSALAEARTIAFKRTASNGEVEQSKLGTEYLTPDSQRQRHSSDRILQAKKSTQIYSVPVDTIRKANINGHVEHGKVKSPSPVNSHVPRPPQQDYTEPWACASKDGTVMGKSHIKTSGSYKKKENVSSASDTSVSPPPLSPDDANSDDYEEPWDKLKRPNVYRKKSREKPVGRVSPLPPTRPVPKPPVDITKEVPKPLSPVLDEDCVTKPRMPPRRTVSCKTTIVSDYSMPCDTKRLSDTVVNVSPYLKPVEQFPLHDDSSSEELSPTPPPLPVRYSSAPLINASLALEEQP